VGQDSVGLIITATRYGVDGPGIESWWGAARFSGWNNRKTEQLGTFAWFVQSCTQGKFMNT
jgi:hypothetical protein